MRKFYTSKEIGEILEVSDKSVRRYLNSYFFIENGAYKVSEKMLETLKLEHLGQASDASVQEFDRVEYFTEEEYLEFQKRLVEYPLLKKNLEDSLDLLKQSRNDIEYHKKAYLKHLDVHERLIISIQERNLLEAFDKKSPIIDPER